MKLGMCKVKESRDSFSVNSSKLNNELLKTFLEVCRFISSLLYRPCLDGEGEWDRHKQRLQRRLFHKRLCVSKQKTNQRDGNSNL